MRVDKQLRDQIKGGNIERLVEVLQKEEAETIDNLKRAPIDSYQKYQGRALFIDELIELLSK